LSFAQQLQSQGQSLNRSRKSSFSEASTVAPPQSANSNNGLLDIVLQGARVRRAALRSSDEDDEDEDEDDVEGGEWGV
jgi:hypothetical protein